MKKTFWILLLLIAAPAAAQPARTTIADTLYDQAGNRLTGTLTITNKTSFTAADGTFVAAGMVIRVPISNGAFSVQLIPNTGSTPSGSSYSVGYQMGTAYQGETWIVPASQSTVNHLAVLAASAITPSITVSIQQLTPPSNCSKLLLQWTGTQWSCAELTTAMTIEAPTTEDSGKFQLKFTNAQTLRRISCDTNTGTLTINLEVRSEAAPNTPTGTAVLSSGLQCTATGGASTTFSVSSIAAHTPLALTISAASGNPGVARIYVEH